MTVPVIIAAKRTPIGKKGGIFRNTPPEKLGAYVIESLLQEKSINPHEIDEVILGNAVGPGGNIARLTALSAGLPVDVPAFTIDGQCGAGLEAINIACRKIQAGAGDIFIAGGVESTSLAPWRIQKPKSLYEEPRFYARAPFSPEEVGDPEMGEAAENVAEQYGITKEEQDYFALESHRKAVTAQDSHVYEDEIVEIHGHKKDECPRSNLTIRKLSALRPIFRRGGTVSVGNTCPMNDGAAAVLIMSERKSSELGLTPILKFIDAASAGVHPAILGAGPIPAVQKLFRRTGLNIGAIDVIEFNEAFASQVLASAKALDMPLERMNVGGGALALGHPFGASGGVLVTRLCTEAKRNDGEWFLATLGIGGGLGLATVFQRYQA